MQRKEFLKTHPEFHPGATAHSADGEDLGEIQKLEEEKLIIEKGRLFDDDHAVDYDQVADIRGDRVVLSLHREHLQPRRPGSAPPPEVGLPGALQMESDLPAGTECDPPGQVRPEDPAL